MAPDLSIVIPVYNEAVRIPQNFPAILSYVAAYPLTTELIFVDDGSTDATRAVLEGHRRDSGFQVVWYQKNRGKGYAVRQGVLASRGRWVMFFDIDLATPLEELAKLVPHIKAGQPPVILGNRAAARKGESGLRRFLGQGFTLLSRVFVPDVGDFTCGFKCFRRDAADRIFRVARINRWAFDTEIIYLARYFGFSIVQIPVRWMHDQSSRVRVFRDVIRSLSELVLLAWFSLSGGYTGRHAPWFRTHGWTLIGIGFLVLLIQSPLIAFPYYAGERYQGINIAQFGNDEHLYLARGKEVLEGGGLGQAFLSEGKSNPDPTFSIAEHLILLPALLSGQTDRVDVVTYYNIANSVGIFLLALLMYLFVLSFSGSRLLAAGAALFAIGGYSLIYNKALFYTDFNIYGRSMFPYVSSIPFFAFLISLYQAVGKGRGIHFAIFAGAMAGLLVYIYFYAWTFAFAVLGSLFVVYALLRAWQAVRDILIASVAAFFIGIPVFAGLFSFLLSPHAASESYFLFASHGHVPVMSLVGLATLALFGWYAYRNRRDPNAPFILALIAAGWVALNQQLISGLFLQYGHYYWYFIVPISILVGSYMLWKLLPTQLRAFLPVALIVIACINTVGGQYRSFPTTVEGKMREQDFTPILSALRELPPGGVFMGASRETYPFLITIYTKDDFYWVPAAALFPFPPHRLEETLLLHLYLHREARSNPRAFLESELAANTIDSYISLYTELEGWQSGLDYYEYARRKSSAANDPVLSSLRPKLLERLADEYKNVFASPGAARALLQKAGVQYVIWDMREFPELDMSALGKLTILATSTDLVLYSIVQDVPR